MRPGLLLLQPVRSRDGPSPLSTWCCAMPPGRKPDYTPGRSGGALRGCLQGHASSEADEGS